MKIQLILRKVILLTTLIYICPIAQSAIIYSSLPDRGYASSAVTLTQDIAVQFTANNDFLVNSISIPFTLLDSTIPRSVEIQLWDNKFIDVGDLENGLRGRPNQIIGSWLSTPITQLGQFTPDNPGTLVSAFTSENPQLLSGQDYWIKVIAGWDTFNDPDNFRTDPINAQWGGSTISLGLAQDFRIVQYTDYINEPDGVNLDPGAFLAFQVEGTTVVPLPATLWLFISGLFVLFYKLQHTSKKHA